ncbi:MAG: hypothetical protein P1V20_03090 [Verrucomicrobiales bacterium]|nr:hypothetical protein [Verrucomicrobiales bacterium]
MMAKPLFVLTFALFIFAFPSAKGGEILLKDDFSDAKDSVRRASRGDWTFSDGIASCTQDDELYKKYKDHGPIIFYDLAHKDASISFSFKATDAKSVVFTANGDKGHVFRFVMSSKGLSVRAFPPDSETKSIATGREPDVQLNSGQWTEVSVQLKGDSATIKIGDSFEKTYQHASYDLPKKNLSIGFAFGSISVKNWVVTK